MIDIGGEQKSTDTRTFSQKQKTAEEETGDHYPACFATGQRDSGAARAHSGAHTAAGGGGGGGRR